MFCDVKDVISSIFFAFYLVVSCPKYSCSPPQNTIFWYMTLNFHFERVLLLNVTIWWDDVSTRQTCSASSQKHWSAGRHVVPLWQIIPIPHQPVPTLSP